MIKGDEEEEAVLLGSPDSMTDSHAKLLGLIDAILLDNPIEKLMEMDVQQLDEAIEKLTVRAREMRETMLQEEEILKLSRLRVDSKAPSPVQNAESTSGVSTYSDDLDLDFSCGSDDESDLEEDNDDRATHNQTPQIKRPPLICLSSDSEVDSKESIVIRHTETPSIPRLERNVSNRDFISCLTKDKQFLKMKKIDLPFDATKLDLEYPLGVTYDDPSRSWYMTDSRKKMVVRIRIMNNDEKGSEYSLIKNPLLMYPSAICVLKEGSKIAVLCENKYKCPAIRVIDIHTEKVSDFCSFEDEKLHFCHQSRGLARSKGGNLMTMDRRDKTPRLRLFTRELRQKTFELKGGSVPSFIASSGETVVITDLGARQTVLHIRLDDTKWDDVDFQILRVISDLNVNLKSQEMLNKQYFVYVAGVQVDRNGNIIIADAKNHHFKLFKPSMNFIHRISTDFPVPYVSSFHVNQNNEIMILSIREDKKLHFAQLTSTERLEPHITAPTVRRRPMVRSYLDQPRRYSSRDSQRSSKSKKPRISKKF